MKITKEWIDSIFPLNKTLTYKQCRMLKIVYPAKSGWKKNLEGKIISDEKINEFVNAGKKKEIEPLHFENGMQRINVLPLLTEDKKHVIITEEWLRSWMTSGLGINKMQASALGVNPLRSGWIKGIVGDVITLESAQNFMKNKLACSTAPKISKKKRKEYNNKFIKTFLRYDPSYKCTSPEGTLRAVRRAQNTCSPSVIIDAIKKMPYKTFLCTPYWKIIASYEKYEAGKKCVLCGSTKMLNVHHKTYVHHGNEAFYLDDLITVCRQCHMAIHGIKE